MLCRMMGMKLGKMHNVENMNGLSVVSEIANQYGYGNVVTTPAEGNGNGINSNPIRCYNCQGEGHYDSNFTGKSRKWDAAYLQQQLQISQEEEAGIQSTQEEFEFMTTADAYEETERVKVNCTSEDTLQQASTSGTQFDNAPVYDSDGSTEVPKDETCYDHDIFNMLTHEVQYTDLQTELDPYNDMQQNIKRLQAQLGDLKGKSSDTQCASNTLDPVSQKLEDENVSLEFQGELFGNSGNTQCVSNDFSDTLIDFLSNGFMDLHGNTPKTDQLFSRREQLLVHDESRFKTSCSIDKDKYMMKAQAHVSKSFAISDEQALPQKNIFDKIARQ
ncbi:hypothetical protein Tco_0116433 [Tanacetum coccineum]